VCGNSLSPLPLGDDQDPYLLDLHVA
jgi:hypothetical protein